MHRVGTKVELIHGISGTIVGHGTLDREACAGNVLSDVCSVYLVELDGGFFDPSNRCYVSVMVVHGDSLKAVPVPVPAVFHESGCALGRCATCY